jgi:hypothetical protein
VRFTSCPPHPRGEFRSCRHNRQLEESRRILGAAGRTVSALDVAQFITPDLDTARRAEIAAAMASSARATP